MSLSSGSPIWAMQEVFKCHKATDSQDHVGLLLKKFRYGLEYASLEVKNHLEQVVFCDLVETIMILSVHLKYFPQTSNILIVCM
jgi:DNA-directed RNA polymerase IV subunit 1